MATDSPRSIRKITLTPTPKLEYLLTFGIILGIASLILYVQTQFAGVRLAGLSLTTWQNLGLLAVGGAYGVVFGFKRLFNPLLIAFTLMLMYGFVVSNRLPQLSTMQSLQSYFAFILPIVFFELCHRDLFKKWFMRLIPWLGTLNLGLAIILDVLGEGSFYRVEAGAFRLTGTGVPGHLAMLSLTGLLVVLWQTRQQGITPRLLWLTVLNMAIIVWSGARTQWVFAGLMLGIVTWENRHLLKQPLDPALKKQLKVVAVILMVMLLAYLPQIYARVFVTYDTEKTSRENDARQPYVSVPPDSIMDTVGIPNVSLALTPVPTQTREETEENRRSLFYQSNRVAVFLYRRVTLGRTADTLDIADRGGIEGVVNTSGRLIAWEFYWRAVENDLVWGRGIGAGTEVNQGEIRSYETPHNEYLRLIVDGGLLGLGLAVGAYAIIFRQMWRRQPSLFLAGLIAGFAFTSLLANTLASQAFAIPFWTFLGMTYHQPPNGEAK